MSFPNIPKSKSGQSLDKIIEIRAATHELDMRIKELQAERSASMNKFDTEVLNLIECTPVPREPVRGRFVGLLQTAELMRDVSDSDHASDHILMTSGDLWEVVTWHAKTADALTVVQTLPPEARYETDGLRKLLIRYPPKVRQWYLVRNLEVPTDCATVALVTKDTIAKRAKRAVKREFMLV